MVKRSGLRVWSNANTPMAATAVGATAAAAEAVQAATKKLCRRKTQD